MANDKYDSIYCEDGHGIGFQSLLALPWPDSPDQYILLYYGYGPFPAWATLRPIKLYSARVDMRLNDGLGAVLDKHQIVVQDTLPHGYLQAVRHANGRDWWIVAPEGGTNCYYMVLLSPAGLAPPVKQCFGQSWSDNEKDGQGQAVFAPDGTLYARINWHYGLHVFDFDRCAGTLSNERTVVFPNDVPFQTSGAAISTNSRYLYATTTTRLWQLDLQSASLDSSRILIDTYDGQPFPDYGAFYTSYLAPDHKIYIAGISSHRHLHVINAPDSAGLACDFAQHGVPIPTFNYVSLPNNPHFRLGVLEGSPCDTLPAVDIRPVPAGQSLRITPNPARNYFTFEAGTTKTVSVFVFNSIGQIVYKNYSTGPAPRRIDCPDWPSGCYHVLVSDGSRFFSAKLLKL